MSPFGSKRTLSRRVFGTVFVVAFAAIAVFTVVGSAFLQNNLAQVTRSELHDEAEIVAAALDSTVNDIAVLERVDIDNTRLTLIAEDGTVIYDNQEPASQMENHGQRPEVIAARETGHGSDERDSSTLGEVMLYEAVLLGNGQVVRIAQAQAGVLSILLSFVGPLLIIAAVVIVVSFFAARRESRAIIAPLLDVDLDHPKRNMEAAYAEMVPMLERIESQRQELKLTSLVNDILTLSNLDEAERSESNDAASVLGSTEPVDLPRMLETVQQRLEHVAYKSDVAVFLDAHPAMVIGVPRLLDELAYNLASNAIRYNRPGGSVVLSCGIDEGRPFIRVEDTGIGIAHDEQAKIFERFYRVDKSRSKARGGTGLGLAIVKHAAAFHGATIDLESEPDCGTRITVTFPVQVLPSVSE